MVGSLDRSAAQRLADGMYTLYDRSTFRTFESLAKKLVCSRRTATDILKGQRLPSRDLVIKFVDVCIESPAERQQWRSRLSELWEAARSEKREAADFLIRNLARRR
jgi:hypothetical protein